MQLYEGIVKAGWAKDNDEAMGLLIQCLISINDEPMAELEDFDKELKPGDQLVLYKSNPKGFNAFNVIKWKTFNIDGTKSERPEKD